MTNVTAAKARDQFAELMNRAAYGKERILLIIRGKMLAAIVPAEDIRTLEEVEEVEDRLDIAEIEKAGAEIKREGTAPWAEVKKEQGL